MEFTNPFNPSQRASDAKMMTTGTAIEVATRLSRRSSPRDNFSYPRLSRHGSNESRSSDGSVPGMTDTSDSEISVDDDGIYNTSAGELWDSFWPDNTTSSILRQSQEYHPALLYSRQHSDNFDIEIDPLKRQQPFDAHGRAANITTKDHISEIDHFMTSSRVFQSPPSQYMPKQSPVAYSVYPKIPVTSVQRYPHPPRTSSLSFEPPSPSRPIFSSSMSSKSGHDTNPVFIPPSLASNSEATSQQQSSTTVKTAASVPVSPAYPPPPPPKALRPITSAFNLQDKVQVHKNQNTATVTNNNNNNDKDSVSHNAMAPPPVPLLPSPLPEPLPMRPQPERFVSVFEFDSDSESEADDEGTSFAKRIARGLHKKSGSPKRGAAQRKGITTRFASLDADASRKDFIEGLRNGSSLSRKRGGSLGRIFGLMGR
ncbi:hypothetical protein F4679DRAFT_598078 [Xylaria curta]|nr:hypothetical protein F4679DRAFT_598078 [Xylaria curta]